MSNSPDPFEVATHAAESAGHIYGKLEVTARFIIFPEGGGRPVEFDAVIHDVARRQTELSFHLTPIDAMNLTRPTERKIIAESVEWSRIVWPSLRDNFSFKTARDGNGKWFKVAIVPSGRKAYTNSAGVEVTPTTIKFLAMYNSEAEATAAYETDLGKAPASNGNGKSNGSQPAPTDDTALLFLPALVKAANGDRAVLAKTLAANPLLARFTVDSPEVQALLKAEGAA